MSAYYGTGLKDLFRRECFVARLVLRSNIPLNSDRSSDSGQKASVDTCGEFH